MKYERRPAFLTYHSAEFQGLFRGWVHVLTKVQHQNQGFPLTVAGSDQPPCHGYCRDCFVPGVFQRETQLRIPFPFSDTVFGGPVYPAILSISIFIFKIISNFRVEKMAHQVRALLQRTQVLFLAPAWWFTTTRLQLEGIWHLFDNREPICSCRQNTNTH